MSSNNENKGGCGCLPIGLGSIFGVICSWIVNHSIGWAILHFICGWGYVVWYLLRYVWRVV